VSANTRTASRRARIVSLLAAALLLLGAADAARRPERQITARAAIAGVHLYRATLSPLLPRIGISCRFQPTCSRYAEASLTKYGIVRGTLKSIGRIARCNPWTPMGTVDDP
jgi:uncharacterized protein